MGLMRLGLGALRLEPQVFWALTPMELATMAGVSPKDQKHLGRDWFNALFAAFPDEE